MNNRSIECRRHVELEATLRLALEALGKAIRYGSFHGADWAFNEIESSITAIKEALQSNEQGQKPVAYANDDWSRIDFPSGESPIKGGPLYTAPPNRKPLTLVELSHIFASIPSVPFDGEWQLELARAIEAAHGIKE